MNQDQQDAILKAQQEFFAAATNKQKQDTAMAAADATLQAAHKDALYAAPIRAQKVLQDAIDAQTLASGKRDAQFQVAVDANAVYGAKFAAFNQAIADSMQTGATEQV
jgi:hypothetical protein